MTLSEKPDARTEPERPGHSGVSAEREVMVARAHEGPMDHDTESPAAARGREVRPSDRGRGSSAARGAILVGTLAAALGPWLLRPYISAAMRDGSAPALALGDALVQCAAALAAVFVVLRRLRRHAVPGRRLAYALGLWTTTLGAALTAARALPNAGDVAFDIGLLLLLAALATEASTRSGRSRPA